MLKLTLFAWILMALGVIGACQMAERHLMQMAAERVEVAAR